MVDKKTAKLLRTVKTNKIVRKYLDSKKPKKETGVKLAKATKRTIKASPKPKPKTKPSILESAKQLLVDPIKKNIKKGYWNILKDPFGVAKKKSDTKKL
jgi:hypothetical protein